MPDDMGEGDGAAVDRDHLDRATFGDRHLQIELLSLLLRQLADARASFLSARGQERWMVAHAIKGAARGLGAFSLAECAADIERDPENDALLKRFERLADEIEAFIASMDA